MKKTIKNLVISVIGSTILAFGLYNIHSFSGVTEGGILGLTLLLKNCFEISPSVSSFILNLICYFIGIKTLGRSFLMYSFVSTISFSLVYALFEHFPPVWQGIANYPAIACVAGAIFVGVGVGLCVRVGGAPTGDDALALSFSSAFRIKIEIVYLVSDLVVLVLSLSYIPFIKIFYSLISVILSGRIVGLIQRIKIND